MLTIQQLSYAYRRGQPVLHDVDVQLLAGGTCGLLGLNGSGKSTLLHLITGSLRAQSGRIEVLGRDPGLRHPDLLAQLYMVPATMQLPAWSIERYADTYSPFYPDFDGAYFYKALQLLGLEPTMQLHQISFGQCKKAVLCFAFATGSRVLLLDEPTNGLDTPSKAQFRRLIAGHTAEDRLIMIATHQVRDISSLLDQLVFLDCHSVLLQASVEAVAVRYATVSLSSASTYPGRILYSEPMPGGLHALVENARGVPQELDLELFFNAAMAHPELAASLHLTPHTAS